MAEIKTKPTPVSVDDFLEGVKTDKKRADARTLVDIMRRVSGEEPRMWGPSIIGFGSYHYRYASGHEGDMCRIGFSPRASALTLYINKANPEAEAMLARLGKHKASKGCLYINKLADVDTDVLEELIDHSWRGPDPCDVC